MKTKQQTVLAVVVPALFVGVIGVAGMLGWWQTANVRTPRTLSQAAGTGSVTGVTLYDPADIRGSSRWSEIEGFFGVPVATIAEAFGFRGTTAELGALTAKAVDELYGEVEGVDGTHLDVGTDAVKFFVARLAGLPFEPDEITGLPQNAVDIILAAGAGLTEAQRAELLEREVPQRTTVVGTATVDGASAGIPAAGTTTDGAVAAGTAVGEVQAAPSVAATQPDAAQPSFTFQGRTTFAEVMRAGLTQAQIESVLGMPMGPPTQTVREFCEQNGLSYSTVREGLTAAMAR